MLKSYLLDYIMHDCPERIQIFVNGVPRTYVWRKSATLCPIIKRIIVSQSVYWHIIARGEHVADTAEHFGYRSANADLFVLARQGLPWWLTLLLATVLLSRRSVVDVLLLYTFRL